MIMNLLNEMAIRKEMCVALKTVRDKFIGQRISRHLLDLLYDDVNQAMENLAKASRWPNTTPRFCPARDPDNENSVILHPANDTAIWLLVLIAEMDK